MLVFLISSNSQCTLRGRQYMHKLRQNNSTDCLTMRYRKELEQKLETVQKEVGDLHGQSEQLVRAEAAMREQADKAAADLLVVLTVRTKTEAEKKAIRAAREKRKREKEQRRKEQEKNVKKKEDAKGEHKKKSLEGMKVG